MSMHGQGRFPYPKIPKMPPPPKWPKGPIPMPVSPADAIRLGKMGGIAAARLTIRLMEMFGK